MSITLYAGIRLAPSLVESGIASTAREVRGEGEDYDAAKAAVDEQLPPGWQLLGYSRWPSLGA